MGAAISRRVSPQRPRQVRMADGWGDWPELHRPTWPEVAWGAGLFVAFAVVSVVATGFIMVRLPADYFAGPTPPDFWAGRHPVLRAAGRVGQTAAERREAGRDGPRAGGDDRP